MTDDEFERFHAETSGALHAYLMKVGGVDSLADDLVQTAYVRLLTSKSLPDDGRARRVYLFRTARNLLTDELRRRARAQRSSADASDGPGAGNPDPESLADDRADGLDCESRIEVRRAFDGLSERDRELLWLAYVIGLDHREIAEVAGVGASSVKVLLFRARSRFSEALDGHGIGPEDLG